MLCFITTIRGRTLRVLTASLVHKMDRVDRPYTGKTSTQVHKVDGPHEGLKFMSIKWTVTTRVKNLHKSTKWTDPTRDQDSCPQSGRTPRGIKIHVHKVDGPNKGKKLT